MGIRISEMEEATTFGADDYVPIVTSGTNKKALGSKIKDFIAGFFVSKSGDTMTGALNQSGSDPKYSTVNSDVTLSSDEHNGLSATKNQRLTFNDSTNNDNRYIGRVYCEANVNGNNRIGFQIGNMNTSGSFQNSNFFMYKNKDGSTSYSVTDSAAFRSAINATEDSVSNASLSFGTGVSGEAYYIKYGKIISVVSDLNISSAISSNGIIVKGAPVPTHVGSSYPYGILVGGSGYSRIQINNNGEIVSIGSSITGYCRIILTYISV